MITFKRPSFFSCLLLFPTDRQIRFLSCRRWRNFGQHKVGSGKPLASDDLNFVEKKTLHLTATIRRFLIISMIAKWRESRAETSGTVLKGDKRVRILQLQNGTSVGGETESGRIVYHPVTQNVVRWLPMDQHNPYTVHVILRFPLYLFCRDESVAVPTMVNVITGNGADHLWWTLLINV